MNATFAIDTLIDDADFFVDPYPAYSQLRAQAPVVWSDRWGGWVLTRYADVVAVLRAPRLYSSAGRIHYILDRLPAAVRSETTLLEAHYGVGIAHTDPPIHTRLRAILTPWFTPRVLEELRPRIRTLAQELVRAALAKQDFDFMADIAYPLPAIVVLEMLGAPAADAHLFHQWALDVNELFAGGGRTTVEKMRRAQAGLREMRDYIGDMIRTRRASPTDDLMGRLVHVEASSDRMSDDELISTAVTLFVAGHETTTNLLGNGMHALLRHPQAMQALRAQPQLMPSAVEEMLRYDTPVQRSWRIATEDHMLHDEQIRAGDMLLVLIGSANRDVAQFAEADHFDIARRDNKHLGLGMGIHFCLGAPLARIEVPEVLHALLAQSSDLQLATGDALRWRHDIALRGVESLPIHAQAATIHASRM